MNIRVSLSNLQADVGNQITESLERGEYAWDIVAWNVGIYLGAPVLGAVFSGLWQALPKVPGVAHAAQVLGEGGMKVVHAAAGFADRAIAVLKPGKALSVLEEEIGSLIGLGRAGLPVPKLYGVTEIEGRAAYVMERFGQGSKDIVKTVNGTVQVVGTSPFLNARSAEDLKKIRQIMQEKQIWVNDLQFLIGEDGRIVVADPIGFTLGEKGPSDVNLKTIQKLIDVASGS